MHDVTVLDIQDNGVGFALPPASDETSHRGLGLRAMRERVEETGGTVAVESSPGDGTTVVVSILTRSARPEDAKATSHVP
jgi:signal transduction histidine kinase